MLLQIKISDTFFKNVNVTGTESEKQHTHTIDRKVIEIGVNFSV